MLREISLTVILIAATTAVAPAQTDWSWHKPLAAGKTLEIKNIWGDINATPASGNEVEVIARKQSGARDVEIKVEEDADGVTICTIYEAGDDCHDQGRHEHSHRRNRDRDNQDVDFEVRVPRGVEFSGHSVLGDVTATDMSADVEAGTVTGNVRVSTSGIAHASSVSGNVHARIGRNDWDDLSFSTVSGDVVLELPQDLNATVRFNTLSGDFDSDWPITITRQNHNRYGPRGGFRGTIGNGGRELSVSTVSGSLELRKATAGR